MVCVFILVKNGAMIIWLVLDKLNGVNVERVLLKVILLLLFMYMLLYVVLKKLVLNLRLINFVELLLFVGSVLEL